MFTKCLDVIEKKETPGGGGVFILAEKELTITREEELETDCELLWCRVEIQESKSLHIAAYYRPNEKMNTVLMSSRNRYIDWGNVTMVS